nr:aminotransferase class I/II-fold pyridoxal phosphate-dependent enzyme [Pseudomonas sp. BN417]
MYQALLREQLETLKSSNQYRTFTTLSRMCGQYPLAKLEGRDQEPVVVWCSNDYLGMSQHPVVRERMHEALETYGAGSGGSRNIGGSHEVYARLEASLADWHGKEAALVSHRLRLQRRHHSVPAAAHPQLRGDQRRTEPRLHRQRHPLGTERTQGLPS